MQDANAIAIADLLASVRALTRGFDAVRLELRELRAAIESQRPVVEVAEADRRALADLLPAIGVASGGWWAVGDLQGLAVGAPDLRRVLRAHRDTRALGRLLGRCEGARCGDWVLERGRESRRGVLRRVVFSVR